MYDRKKEPGYVVSIRHTPSLFPRGSGVTLSAKPNEAYVDLRFLSLDI